jgi:hypothetical protein
VIYEAKDGKYGQDGSENFKLHTAEQAKNQATKI